jgi:hypothetical protein
MHSVSQQSETLSSGSITGHGETAGFLGWGRVADNTTATRIEMQAIKEDKKILDVPFKQRNGKTVLG